jgi:hypothetical protein
MELTHIVHRQNHITGTIDMLCGERRTKIEEPLPGSAACADCYGEALNLLRQDMRDAGRTIMDIAEVTDNTNGLVRELSATLRGIIRRQKKREKKGDD